MGNAQALRRRLDHSVWAIKYIKLSYIGFYLKVSQVANHFQVNKALVKPVYYENA